MEGIYIRKKILFCLILQLFLIITFSGIVSASENIIFIHGFFRSSSDMEWMKEEMEEYGYNSFMVDLPLSIKEFDEVVMILEEEVKTIMRSLDWGEEVNFVAHSTGGLVLRKYLAKNSKYHYRINRCVLLGVPNQGSDLIKFSSRHLGFVEKVLRTMEILHPDNIKNRELYNSEDIEIGAIAGNKDNLLLGVFISEESDGMVEVESVKYEGLTDFTVVPYNHRELIRNREVAILTHNFLQKGEF